MKKLLAILLAAAMVMSFIVVPVAAEENHNHCWCENTEVIPEGHECETFEWTKLSSAIVSSKVTIDASSASTHFYRDNTTATSLTVDGVDAYLCLNGNHLRAQTVLTLKNGASLTICDCSESQEGVLSTTKYTPVTVEPECSVNLMSGTIRGTYSQTASRISVKLTGGTFNMYGGTITAGCATTSATNKEDYANGGNVSISSGAFYMHGGTISDGRTVFNGTNGGIGGNISVNNGSFTMYGGTVTGGHSVKYGGNIAILGGGTGSVTINGGIVENGVADTNGGNISAMSGTVTIKNAQILGGQSTAQGGNIAAAGGTIIIKAGALISGGTATTYGGNISANNAGHLIVEGGTIELGTATTYGGNIGINASTSSVTISGGTIERGTATTHGGNIAATAGSVTIENAQILGGQSTTAQGGSISAAGGTVTIKTGASVSGGTATTYGGNIAVNNSGHLIVEGGTIELGTATTYGGNIGILAGTLNIEGGSITNGTATTHGGNIGMGGGSMTMTGGTVSGGTAPTAAGMSMQNASVASVTGGEFVEGGIYFNSSKTLTIGGTANIQSIYHTGKEGGTLALDKEAPFTGHTGINMSKPGVFLETTTDLTENFTSYTTGYGVHFNGTAMELTPNAVQALDGTTVIGTYATVADALAAGNYVKLLKHITEDVEITGDVYLDLNGWKLTGDVTGEGTLYGMDSSGDDYSTPTGKIHGTVSCNLAGNFKSDVTGSIKRYMTIVTPADEGSFYTFHRFYLGITHMTLKPGTTGIGYKAVFHADEQVQELLAEEDAFGYTLQVEGFDAKSVALDKADFVSGKVITLRVNNVDVATYGETAIKGKVFMTFGDTVIESSEYTSTMKTMVETVAASLVGYTNEQISALKTMCEANSTAMEGWEIDSILNYTAE